MSTKEKQQPVKLGAWVVTPAGLTGVRLADEKFVRTSAIVQAQGRLVQTVNTLYELVGDPSPEWVDYCKLRGWQLDLANPAQRFLSWILVDDTGVMCGWGCGSRS